VSRHYVRAAALSVRPRTFIEFGLVKKLLALHVRDSASGKVGGWSDRRNDWSPFGERPLCAVILNGGEAAVRDRTTAGGFDVVDRNS
jgi:hypothetical protein